MLEKRKSNFKEVLLLMTKTSFIKKFRPLYFLLAKGYATYFKLYNWVVHGDPYFLRNVLIELATDCNRTCRYCPNYYNPTPEKYMDEATFKKVIERLKEINFSGLITYNRYNEPLLDKRLPELVAYAKRELPKSVHRIFTNGDFLTMELAGKLIQAGLSEIFVTLHDKNPQNRRKKLEPVAERFPRQVYINLLDYQFLSTRGGSVDVDNPSILTKCIETPLLMPIDYQGNVLFCCEDYHKKHKAGNLLTQSIKEIWYNEKYQKLRKDLRKGKPELDICKNCFGIGDNNLIPVKIG